MAMASSSGGNAQINFNEFLDQKVNRAGKVSGNGAEPDADNAGDKHYRDGNDQ